MSGAFITERIQFVKDTDVTVDVITTKPTASNYEKNRRRQTIYLTLTPKSDFSNQAKFTPDMMPQFQTSGYLKIFEDAYKEGYEYDEYDSVVKTPKVKKTFKGITKNRKQDRVIFRPSCRFVEDTQREEPCVSMEINGIVYHIEYEVFEGLVKNIENLNLHTRADSMSNNYYVQYLKDNHTLAKEILKEKQKEKKEKKKCSVEGCIRKYYARSYCSVHYQRARRKLNNPNHILRRSRICSKEDCSEKIHGKGFCRKHYDQLRYK